MKSLATILNFGLISIGKDLGLFALRVGLGLSMFLLHGLSKLQGYGEKVGKFPDPLGVGSQTSLMLAIFSEVFCAVLLVLGLFTRIGALALAITMAVAFFMVHQGVLSGENSGELALVYGLGYLSLFLAGGGRFSLDKVLGLEK